LSCNNSVFVSRMGLSSDGLGGEKAFHGKGVPSNPSAAARSRETKSGLIASKFLSKNPSAE
jgi:hypothetical protein